MLKVYLGFDTKNTPTLTSFPDEPIEWHLQITQKEYNYMKSDPSWERFAKLFTSENFEERDVIILHFKNLSLPITPQICPRMKVSSGHIFEVIKVFTSTTSQGAQVGDLVYDGGTDGTEGTEGWSTPIISGINQQITNPRENIKEDVKFLWVVKSKSIPKGSQIGDFIQVGGRRMIIKENNKLLPYSKKLKVVSYQSVLPPNR